jgi:predicted GTPase
MEGEIGTGKSSTCNALMYLQCLKLGIKIGKEMTFKYGRQTGRVTS